MRARAAHAPSARDRKVPRTCASLAQRLRGEREVPAALEVVQSVPLLTSLWSDVPRRRSGLDHIRQPSGQSWLGSLAIVRDAQSASFRRERSGSASPPSSPSSPPHEVPGCWAMHSRLAHWLRRPCALLRFARGPAPSDSGSCHEPAFRRSGEPSGDQVLRCTHLTPTRARESGETSRTRRGSCWGVSGDSRSSSCVRLRQMLSGSAPADALHTVP
jgi:hypothetical protein